VIFFGLNWPPPWWIVLLAAGLTIAMALGAELVIAIPAALLVLFILMAYARRR
jgi:hypothetical protein